jgi:signal peptidase I
MSFNKNLFLVPNDDMHPYVSKGDVVIFEPMQLGYRTPSSVYIVKYKGKKRIARVHFLIKGGMCLLFDGDKEKTIEFKQLDCEKVVFIGHVIGRVLKSGELLNGYKLYHTPSFD